MEEEINILESIKKEEDIIRILKEGINLNNKYFIAYITSKENTKVKIKTRLVITKKIGKAVLRNKIKRILREILRSENSLNNKEIEIIIFAKKEIKNANFRELKFVVDKILKQI